MIYLDHFGFPVDKTGDGGDSAMRNGVLAMCNHPDANAIDNYEYRPGILQRHPTDYPWNNPWNFTRDQLMPCIPGMTPKLARRVFWQCLKRFSFAQNFQRDKVNTWKFPWPHDTEDGRRSFDFADPLFPNHMGALLLASKLYLLYPLLLIAYPIHLLAILIHSRSNHYEESQMIAECYMYGTLPIYKRIHKRWRQVSWGYWMKRGEGEYHTMLERLVDKA